MLEPLMSPDKHGPCETAWGRGLWCHACVLPRGVVQKPPQEHKDRHQQQSSSSSQ